MVFLPKEIIHPLNISGVLGLSFIFNFTISFTFASSSSLKIKKLLFLRMIVLSIYILMILNGVLIFVIRRHGLNVEVTIKSFFL